MQNLTRTTQRYFLGLGKSLHRTFDNSFPKHPLVSPSSSSAAAVTNVQRVASSSVDPDLKTAKPFDDIPGKKGFWYSLKTMFEFFPAVGKQFDEKFNLHDLHMEYYEDFGKLVRIDLFNIVKIALVYDPNDIQKVFRHEGQYPRRIMLHALKKYREDRPHIYNSSGILIENNEKWHNVRSNVQAPMLRPLVVDTYLPSMETVATDFVARMKYLRDDKMECPQYLNELYKWALESVGLVAFNTRLGCLNKNLKADSETQLLIKAVNDSFLNIHKTEFGLPFWKIFPSKEYRKFSESQDFCYEIAVKYFNKTLEEIRNHPQNDEIGGILGVYIRNGKVDQNEILTFMLDILAAGIDTTSHSMAFTLYLLARNQDKQEKAYQEIAKVISPETKLSRKVLDNLPYLRACVKESMRLMAVVEGSIRILDHDIALSGHRIPAGTTLILLTQIASCLPENFSAPEQFLPERWLNDAPKPHPFANLPFSYGPRMCIGRRLATQEIHLLLIKILQNFKIEYHYDDIRCATRFVNIPDKPLKFSFIDRD